MAYVFEANISENERNEIPLFDGAAMGKVLSELNTEAKCIATLFTPQVPTLTSDINNVLQEKGAFDFEPRQRFNVGGILKSMPDIVATTISDPMITGGITPRQWAQKNPTEFGNYLDGLAGSLIDFSYRHNRPLRTILGEKIKTEQSDNFTELRICILASIAKLSAESSKQRFTRKVLYEQLEEFVDFDSRHKTISTISAHLDRLTSNAIISEVRNGKTINMRPSTRMDGTESLDEISDLLLIIGNFAIASKVTIDEGKQKGLEILDSKTNIAALVKRSYSHTAHTGKTR